MGCKNVRCRKALRCRWNSIGCVYLARTRPKTGLISYTSLQPEVMPWFRNAGCDLIHLSADASQQKRRTENQAETERHGEHTDSNRRTQPDPRSGRTAGQAQASRPAFPGDLSSDLYHRNYGYSLGWTGLDPSPPDGRTRWSIGTQPCLPFRSSSAFWVCASRRGSNEFLSY